MKDYLEEIGVKDSEYKTEKISFYEHDESVQRRLVRWHRIKMAARTTGSIEWKKIKYYESINKLCLPPFFPSLYLCRLLAFILPFRFAVISVKFFIHFAAKPNTAEQCPEVLSSIFNGLVYHCVWSPRTEWKWKNLAKTRKERIKNTGKASIFLWNRNKKFSVDRWISSPQNHS